MHGHAPGDLCRHECTHVRTDTLLHVYGNAYQHAYRHVHRHVFSICTVQPRAWTCVPWLLRWATFRTHDLLLCTRLLAHMCAIRTKQAWMVQGFVIFFAVVFALISFLGVPVDTVVICTGRNVTDKGSWNSNRRRAVHVPSSMQQVHASLMDFFFSELTYAWKGAWACIWTC